MNREPRILIYDIETSPIIGYTWGVWDQNVIEIIDDYQILTVAWKWLGEKKVHVIGQDDFPNYKPGVNDDIEVVKKVHELFDEADIVIAHNGNSFDQKKMQARMMIHHLAPPSPYKQIDTKLVAKRYAAFTRNNLKWLNKDLNLKNQKGDPGGFATWLGCLAGDKKSWKTMKTYNKGDITSLEDLYLELRPWITNHPNIAVISQKPNACINCGDPDHLQSRGTAISNSATYRRFQCTNCGKWQRTRIKDAESVQTPSVYTNI